MTLKTYIWGMRLIGLLSLAALAIIVNYVDPQNSDPAEMLLFYLAAFPALVSLFNLFLIFIRHRMAGNETAAFSAGLSFRQGTLLAAAALGILALQSYRMLVWWDALLVIAGAFLAELYFLSRS